MEVQQPQAHTEFQNAPIGDHQAVIVDLLDLGWQMQEHMGQKKGMAPRVQPVLQIAEQMEPRDGAEIGERFQVRYRKIYVKWSTGGPQQTAWEKFLNEVFGVVATQEIYRGALELGEFDENMLIGANVSISVFHNPSTGADGTPRIYANIAEMSRWRDNMGPRIQPANYIRLQDREGYQPPQCSAWRRFPGDIISGEYGAPPQAMSHNYPSAQQQRPQQQQQQAPQQYAPSQPQNPQQAAMRQQLPPHGNYAHPGAQPQRPMQQPVNAYPQDDDSDPFSDS